MIVGLTGSFGSGKSTIAGFFRECGFRVINVDRLYHGIYKRNLILKFKIKKEFGTLNRSEIKKIVFKDSKKLKRLNRITHPVIIKAIKKEIKKIRNKKIVVDIPLLFESKLENFFDKIVVVKCNKKKQFSRLLKTKKYTKKEIENIIGSQMPLKDKLKKADFVVDNSFTAKKSEKQVKEIVSKIV